MAFLFNFAVQSKASLVGILQPFMRHRIGDACIGCRGLSETEDDCGLDTLRVARLDVTLLPGAGFVFQFTILNSLFPIPRVALADGSSFFVQFLQQGNRDATGNPQFLTECADG